LVVRLLIELEADPGQGLVAKIKLAVPSAVSLSIDP
jgi:hypothetical protein